MFGKKLVRGHAGAMWAQISFSLLTLDAESNCEIDSCFQLFDQPPNQERQNDYEGEGSSFYKFFLSLNRGLS